MKAMGWVLVGGEWGPLLTRVSTVEVMVDSDESCIGGMWSGAWVIPRTLWGWLTSPQFINWDGKWLAQGHAVTER